MCDDKFIDFGFLKKGKELILVQSKKAFRKRAEEYVKVKDIITGKKNL